MTENYYNKNAKSFFNSTINIDMSELYEKFEKHLNPFDYILDLGCGSGRDVLYFKNKGYRVLGIDNSDELIKLAKEYTNSEILKLDFRQLNFSNEFDAIWACASLLHLKRKEVDKVFEKCINALKQNGVIYISFKYGDFEGIRNGRFFTFYNEELMNDLLSNYNNVDLIESWKTQDLRKDRNNEYWLNIIVKKKG